MADTIVWEQRDWMASSPADLDSSEHIDASTSSLSGSGQQI